MRRNAGGLGKLRGAPVLVVSKAASHAYSRRDLGPASDPNELGATRKEHKLAGTLISSL